MCIQLQRDFGFIIKIIHEEMQTGLDLGGFKKELVLVDGWSLQEKNMALKLSDFFKSINKTTVSLLVQGSNKKQ